jgi:hypothetical protein
MTKTNIAAFATTALFFALQACSHNGDRDANAPANSATDSNTGGSSGKDIQQLDALGGKDQSGPPVDPASSENIRGQLRDNASAFAPDQHSDTWMRTHAGDELANGASGPTAGRSGHAGQGSAGGPAVGGSGSR